MYAFSQTVIPFFVLMLSVAGLLAGMIGHWILVKDAHRRSTSELLRVLLVPFYVAYFAATTFTHPRRILVLRAFFGGYLLALLAFVAGVVVDGP